MEKFLYQKSERISVISKSFRQTLLKKGIQNSKIEVIPVWADPNEVRPMPKQNAFRRAHKLSDKFVVMYAGNIGLTSCLEDVLHAAEILCGQKDIQFVIVGEGVRKEALEAEMQTKQLTNILFLPFQPREIFSEMLAAADLSLVTLNANAALSSLPSKIFNVMASARPILAVTPPGSETMQIVEEAGCGWNVPPQSPEKLAQVILQLKAKESALIQMGQNGRACLERNYSRNQCVDAHEKMLIALCDRTQLKAAHAGEIL
jgi:colanic acid biosynthesis glycosyl transferase WcaI